MWPFKKKEPTGPVLCRIITLSRRELRFCCVVKTILLDLRRFDRNEWKFEPWPNGSYRSGSYRSGYYYTISNPAVSYKLFYRTCGADTNFAGVYGVANTEDHFTQKEIDALWEEIQSIRDERSEKAEKDQIAKENAILKQLFPGCYKV